jgi:hypothetical protein
MASIAISPHLYHLHPIEQHPHRPTIILVVIQASLLDRRISRPHALIKPLDAGANITKLQEWLGDANITMTRVSNHRKTRPEDSPVFKVKSYLE